MGELKTDFKKILKNLYNPGTIPETITVPGMQFLSINGQGTTESIEFQNAIGALFTVSFKTKFIMKKEHNFDYTVMPLEGLWWADNMVDFINGNKDNWKWTLMIMQPDRVTQAHIDEATKIAKKKIDSTILDQLILNKFTEGQSVQLMHKGPFSTEYDNIMKIHSVIKEKHGIFDGKLQKHHEIYLSDFRKVAPEKMRTILRQSFLTA